MLRACSVLEDSNFSDVIVVAGTDNKKEYSLHRVILSVNSSYFKAACRKGTFLEGDAGVINLPDIEPEAFDQVVQWMYGGGYKLESPIDEIKIRKVYVAADYLGAPALRREIQSSIENAVIQNLLDVTNEEADIAGPVLRELCSVSHISDWDGLQRISDTLFPRFRFRTSRLQADYTEDVPRGYYRELIIGSLQSFLHLSYCKKCLMSSKRKDLGKRCVGCRGSMDREKQIKNLE